MVRGASTLHGAGPFGGSGHNGVCDTELLIKYLDNNPYRLQAWAHVEGIPDNEAAVASFVRSLKPRMLSSDTRVTDYSYAPGPPGQPGHAYSFQAILQARTAVLVDPSGNPVTRCLCGNPLSYAIFYAEEHCVGCTSGYRLPTPAIAYTVYATRPTVVTKRRDHHKRGKPPPRRTRTVTVVAGPTTTVPSTVTRIVTVPITHVIYQTQTVISTVTEVATHAG